MVPQLANETGLPHCALGNVLVNTFIDLDRVFDFRFATTGDAKCARSISSVTSSQRTMYLQ